MIKRLMYFFLKHKCVKAKDIEDTFNKCYALGCTPELMSIRAPFNKGNTRETLIRAINDLLSDDFSPKGYMQELPIYVNWRLDGRNAVLTRIKRLVEAHLAHGEAGLSGYSDELLAYLYMGLLEYQLHIPMGIYGHWVEGDGILEAFKEVMNGSRQ